ncbi:HalOD1 output domain-containing protein [Halomicroarcula sp. GCM10025324]|mgnify:CR=1 FL=1|jgi:hypothetical protein|uniref:HalOD1 output domain-containing protein n=1 Tax=Haloarcula TaxID=2237 RepID=UPI0023E8350A|nr:HalOD1 output domain-containing protein [Halomicroarcula sp. ZS-22-S1]
MQYSKESARCTCTPVVGTRFGGDTGRGPAQAIIEGVAAAEDIAPTELTPLYDDVDLEAVAQLFSTAGPSAARPMLLECSVLGWKVYVRGDGALRVCDPERPTDPAPVFEKAICD